MSGDRDLFTILIGGKAGNGVKKAAKVASNLFAKMGRHVFQMDDYQSLIRGGHNFSVLSTSLDETFSHYLQANLAVLLDQRSYDLHLNHLAENSVLIYNSNAVKPRDLEGVQQIGVPLSDLAKRNEAIFGVAAVASLACSMGISEDDLRKLIEEEYKRNLNQNLDFALKVYNELKERLFNRFQLKAPGGERRPILSGNEAIALGAAAGGLDIYYAYPMTPSTSILHFLARYGDDLGVVVVQPENEIAVLNMAIGSAMAGARAMVGTSGGGFGLMAEAFSLAGMVEAPVVIVLSSRPGPSTGVPTYTSQGDLLFAIYQGHGEFPRIVASPGTMEEAFYLAAELLQLAWKFQTPAILLTEKHLSESRKTVELDFEKVSDIISKHQVEIYNPKPGEIYKRYKLTDSGISPLTFPPSREVIKWNSYEHDEYGVTTEDPEVIKSMADKRRRKGESLVEYLKGIRTLNLFNSDSEHDVLVVTYGSTTMSVLESLKYLGLPLAVAQPIYLEPFPLWEFEKLTSGGRFSKVVVVEESSTGLFARLIQEKTSLKVHHLINRYDGRPFEPVELAQELRRVM